MMMIITIIFIITIMITMIIMIFMIIIIIILITIHVFTKEISSNTPAVVRWLDARTLSILTLWWALAKKPNRQLQLQGSRSHGIDIDVVVAHGRTNLASHAPWDDSESSSSSCNPACQDCKT